MHKILSSALLLMLILQVASTQAQVKKRVVKKIPVHTTKSKTVTKVAIVNPVKKIPGIRVKITTNLGDIVIRLSDKTVQHRDNFVKLINEHFYDSLLIHRVVNNFMIQGGDPNSKNAAPGTLLGDGDAGYTIPAEFDSTLYHKRGALAAARNNNPEKASSGCQFYIVEGKKLSDSELDMTEMQNGIHFSAAKRMTYKMNGGTPFLDMNYTVFGEVESGMEVVDKIALE
jgi:cyclophilin family peptidyl-prolyl cis-trans isomerase